LDSRLKPAGINKSTAELSFYAHFAFTYLENSQIAFFIQCNLLNKTLANFRKYEFLSEFFTPKPARGGQASLGVAHKLKVSLRSVRLRRRGGATKQSLQYCF